MEPAVNAEMFVAAILGGFFGGWELLLILAIVLILFLARRLPEIGRGLGHGLRQFGDAADEVTRELNAGGYDAGRSIGGIYGKPAAQAIAHDNRVAEFYAVNEENDLRRGRSGRVWKVWVRSVWRALRWLLRIR